MHGSGGERWKQRRHMWPVHSNSTAVACELSAPDFFLKDGRKIQVGDCALFKPPLDSPPFIGIIRSLKSDQETNLRLDVNWLYRPADVKLPKGISLDAAPNEIFYSFHKDEIPAASLLHPCKVAFLRKGVELPSSISSFVCRRVYDTDNKCLWWLTDRDYINERQEEVDQLLEKTRLEMHGVMQSGGRSPKPLNGSIPAVQTKSGSESVPNSSFLTSHIKSKKRERGDQGSEPIKRERLCKAEDGEFGQFRSESMLKNEIVKITDKGGLIDFEGVEKFVKLIQPDSSGKKIDLADRMMLADVIAVTDRFDCLEWFLQLRGLPVLDEWLQEVHKGKIGDANGMKGSDKTVEDFLLALLRALDKLPVNLNALQTCNVGKSVNHLRTHKNSEIQKKARSLVDTWKKRVEAEMDVHDAKSESSRGVSWPSKSGPLEVSQVGGRKAGGLGDDGLKSSTHSNMFKHSQPKFGPTEMVGKSSALSSTMKFSSTVGASSKDYNFKTLVVGNSDLPLTPIKEERSSSSSQSQNNSQSSDHAKTVASSCKEETRSSNSGSGSVSKVSSGASRHRKSSNGIHLNTLTGIQKVSGSGKLNAINKSLTTEKVSTASHEKSPDASLVEHGYSRLVVKLPNTCRSPMGTSRVVTEDQVVSCHKGSLHDEAGDNHDKKAKGRSDLLGASFGTEANSNQCHKKDQFLSSEEGKEIAACDEQSRLAEANDEQSETIASLTGIISRPGKTYDASLSSINALIESCVKFSETNTSSSPGDAVGMNLLASVATGEISKSNNASPLDSPQERSPLAEESSAVNDGQLKIFPEGIAKNKSDEPDANGGARGCAASEPFGSNSMLQKQNRNGSHPASTSADSSRDGKGVEFGSSRDCIMPSKVQQKMERTPSKSDIKPDAEACDGSAAVCSSYGAEEGNTEIEDKVEGLLDSLLEEGTQLHENKKVDQTDERTIENGVVLKSDVAAATLEVEKQVDAKTSCLSSQLSGSAVQTHEDLTSGCGVEEKLSSTSEIRADSQEEKVEAAMILPEANPLGAEFKDKKEDTVNSEIHVNQIGKQTPIQGPMSDRKNDCAVQDLGKTDDINNCCGMGSMHLESPAIPLPESALGEKYSLNVPELIGTKDHVTNENPSLSASRSNTVVKLDFDLNEGCVDDGTQEEIIGSSSAVRTPILPPFSMPSASESFPVSITVASAAKGSVVPPENSLANKVELGWKGSAATSAFRRAEPRKNLEMPLSLSDASLVTTTSKEGRPPLDFDLNVPDQRLLEEVTLSNVPRKASLESGPSDRGGGLDLDLNKVDESNDMGPCSVSKSRFELPMSSRSYVSGGLGNCGFSVSRNFDLNNGPSLDEMGAETAPLSQQNKNYMPFSSLLPGMKVNSGEIGNFYSWFPQGNSYSAITAIPSVLPGRGEQSYVPAAVSQRVFAPPAGTGFAAEIYRAPVLSSSPALAFPPTNSFSYSGFPFETSFPLQSNTFSGCSTSYMDSSPGCSLGFPTITSHLLGPAGVVPTPYPRPFIMSYPSGSGTVGPEIGKWGSQGLDLNAGHGVMDKERIDEKLPLALRQLSVPSSQPFADEQLKMFQIGGIHKRKEPDSGLDAADRLNYKQQ